MIEINHECLECGDLFMHNLDKPQICERCEADVFQNTEIVIGIALDQSTAKAWDVCFVFTDGTYQLGYPIPKSKRIFTSFQIAAR